MIVVGIKNAEYVFRIGASVVEQAILKRDTSIGNNQKEYESIFFLETILTDV